MAADVMVAAQIVRLLRQHPPGIWDLLDVQDAARTGDVVLRDQDGTPLAYARPATSGTHERTP
jgi:hypothetical protein